MRSGRGGTSHNHLSPIRDDDLAAIRAIVDALSRAVMAVPVSGDGAVDDRTVAYLLEQVSDAQEQLSSLDVAHGQGSLALCPSDAVLSTLTRAHLTKAAARDMAVRARQSLASTKISLAGPAQGSLLRILFRYL